MTYWTTRLGFFVTLTVPFTQIVLFESLTVIENVGVSTLSVQSSFLNDDDDDDRRKEKKISETKTSKNV